MHLSASVRYCQSVSDTNIIHHLIKSHNLILHHHQVSDQSLLSSYHGSQPQTGVLGSVQPQLAEAHGAHGGGQLRLQLHGPDVLQAAQSQAVQQDEGGAEGGRMAPADTQLSEYNM